MQLDAAKYLCFLFLERGNLYFVSFLIVFKLQSNYQISCQKIISGGQTGVDRATLDACLANKFACGGWCPKDRIAEDGPIDKMYPLQETDGKEYIYRTKQNVLDSSATLIIVNNEITGGTLATIKIAMEFEKPLLIIRNHNRELNESISDILTWLMENSVAILNVAGSRASEWKKSYEVSFQLISLLIKRIKNRQL